MNISETAKQTLELHGLSAYCSKCDKHVAFTVHGIGADKDGGMIHAAVKCVDCGNIVDLVNLARADEIPPIVLQNWPGDMVPEMRSDTDAFFRDNIAKPENKKQCEGKYLLTLNIETHEDREFANKTTACIFARGFRDRLGFDDVEVLCSCGDALDLDTMEHIQRGNENGKV